MTKERLDEIIKNINKYNILQSCCGGTSSYDYMICELLEYTLNLQEEKEKLIKYIEDKINMCDGYIDTTRSDLEEVKYNLFVYDILKKSIEENIKAKNIYQDILERIKNNNYE